jgi:hypothetical protein
LHRVDTTRVVVTDTSSAISDVHTTRLIGDIRSTGRIIPEEYLEPVVPKVVLGKGGFAEVHVKALSQGGLLWRRWSLLGLPAVCLEFA